MTTFKGEKKLAGHRNGIFYNPDNQRLCKKNQVKCIKTKQTKKCFFFIHRCQGKKYNFVKMFNLAKCINQICIYVKINHAGKIKLDLCEEMLYSILDYQ